MTLITMKFLSLSYSPQSIETLERGLTVYCNLLGKSGIRLLSLRAIKGSPGLNPHSSGVFYKLKVP